MISVPKLLLLAVVIVGVFYLMRAARRASITRVSMGGIRGGARRPRKAENTGAHSAPSATPPVEDLVKCSACGAYVPSGRTGGCGRPDCPMP